MALCERTKLKPRLLIFFRWSGFLSSKISYKYVVNLSQIFETQPLQSYSKLSQIQKLQIIPQKKPPNS